jgi:hypothetical protein
MPASSPVLRRCPPRRDMKGWPRTPDGFSFDRPMRLFSPDTFVGLRNGLAPARNGQFFIVTTVVRDPSQLASVVLNWQPRDIADP